MTDTTWKAEHRQGDFGEYWQIVDESGKAIAVFARDGNEASHCAMAAAAPDLYAALFSYVNRMIDPFSKSQSAMKARANREDKARVALAKFLGEVL